MIISTSLYTLISNQSQLLTFWMIIEVIRWTNLLSNLGVGIIVKHCLGIDIVLITIIAIAALVRINNLGCKITTRIDRYFVRNSYGLYDVIKKKCLISRNVWCKSISYSKFFESVATSLLNSSIYRKSSRYRNFRSSAICVRQISHKVNH